jgi:hypothetical protein
MNVFKQGTERGAAEYCATTRIAQFGKGIDQRAYPQVCVCGILSVACVDSGISENVPHVQLRSRVWLPKVCLQGRELFWSSRGADSVKAPRAHLGKVALAAVEVLRLDLGVLPEREENVERVVVITRIKGRPFLNGKAANYHRERHGEVIRIDCKFVDLRGPLTV